MKNVITLVLFAFSITVFSQDFRGEATYKSHRKLDLKTDSKNENSALHKQLRAQLTKSYQREYTLIFSREESVYKQNESLAKPTPNTSGITFSASGGSDIMYKNIKDMRFTKATEIYGKQFLIKDSLKAQDWKFINETKKIGAYTCNKAIFTETYQAKTVTDQGEIETIDKTRETTAWYTMQIPVNNGPSNFSGLPGLILEINDGELTLICSKIIINSKNEKEIKEPKKGKIVTQDRFNEIKEKKNNEMMERFKSRRKNVRSQSILFGG